MAFFICWAPFHAQRLMAVYANNTDEPPAGLVTVYTALTYISGIFYYLSTTVNPLLYNIMSNKFREAFKVIYLFIIIVTKNQKNISHFLTGML